MKNGNDERAGVDFLDFLFTVAISIGLTPELLQIQHVTGLLSEEWHKAGRWPSIDEFFNIGVFLLGLFTLTLSWFGYHASIIRRPLNNFSGYGMARFVLDVFLVIMFGIMLIKYKSFDVALSLFGFIFFIYVIWDFLKIREYRDEFEKKTGTFLERYRRELVTVFWFVAVAFIAFLHFSFHFNRWLILALAILITFFYRINKNYAIWERLFGVKSA